MLTNFAASTPVPAVLCEWTQWSKWDPGTNCWGTRERSQWQSGTDGK